jgi:hypothetical protein
VALDGAHPTPTQSGDSIPVSYPGTQKRATVLRAADGSQSYKDIDALPGGKWKQMQ